jgi:decaprenylphospho-beta-D-erythro-pentofuranosid-2-ulose 2-reductase
MTTHMKAAGKRLATPVQVARITVDAIRRGKVEVYAPKLWRYIMLIVRHMPRPILNRLPI